MLATAFAAPVSAAEVPQQEIDAAVKRGANALKQHLRSDYQSGAAVLAALALVKAGEPVDGPEVAAVVAAVQARCSGSLYQAETHHKYTAGLELMLLEAVDGERYRGEMQKILAYVLAEQTTGGGWFYPGDRDLGDTSITQYATLGLWAASRAGLSVPDETWDRLALWHMRWQLPNGAFTYHPGQGGVANPPSPALTIGGASSILLARLHLFRGGGAGEPQLRFPSQREAQTGKRFGILESVDLNADDNPDPTVEKKRVEPARVQSSSSGIQQSANRAIDFTAATFHLPPPTPYPLYYLYGLERMAALGNLKKLGEHDWYDEGAAWLLQNQNREGTWNQDSSGAIPGTAFAVLFLTKPTAKALGRAIGPPGLGGGLLAGGRGLPDDLGRVNLQSGDVKTRTAGGPLDELLGRLEDAKGADVPGAQQAILEAVRFGDREALIGERERLIRLAVDPRTEVRRTALWALGRGGRLADVPVLIKALSDPDPSVAAEAHNALCVISRRPVPFGIPSHPYDGLPEDAPEGDRKKAAAAWSEKATAAWREWYRQVAPYDERDGLGVFR